MIEKARRAIRKRMGRRRFPPVAIILGSGLADAISSGKPGISIAYGSIPGFPRSTVPGHEGRLIIGDVAILSGRVHLYEGKTFDEVTFPVRALASLGTRILLVTNAAGGIHPSLRPGHILGIKDHLNLQGTGPTGPRFVSMAGAYDPELLKTAASVARSKRIPFRRGVYAAVRGPAYETPAEIRMLRTLGADAVGMSTVPEVIAARERGVRCLGLSMITNTAAGGHAGEVSHEEVLHAGAMHAARLARIISGVRLTFRDFPDRESQS
jgi:purine-nucleoside phosphorylase